MGVSELFGEGQNLALVGWWLGKGAAKTLSFEGAKHR